MSIPEYTEGLHQLNPGVYAYLQPDGAWGLNNTGMISFEGETLLVDTLYDVLRTEKMLAEMRKAHPAAEKIDILVNTHDNGDHWYGNQAAGAEEIISTRAAAEGMALFPPTAMDDLMKAAPTMGDLGAFFHECFKKFHYEGITPTYPTRTFEGRLDLIIGGREVQLIEVGPCHTMGDLIVVVPEARVVFAADIMFIGGHQIMWNGPVENFLKALDLIISFEPEYIVPGHGPVTDVRGAEEIKRYWEHYEGEARKRFNRDMTPYEAAADIDPGQFADYLDPEKVVLNVNSLYQHFKNDPDPLTPVEQFTHMAEFAKTRK